MNGSDAPPTMTEDGIHDLVHTFYARVRGDALLGPIFEAAFAGRWEAHLERMCDFWSTVLLASGRYRGNPIAAHLRIPGIEARHFDRWIELFGEVARDVLPAPLAADVIARATRMRAVLERGIEADAEGRRLPVPERYAAGGGGR